MVDYGKWDKFAAAQDGRVALLHLVDLVGTLSLAGHPALPFHGAPPCAAAAAPAGGQSVRSAAG